MGFIWAKKGDQTRRKSGIFCSKTKIEMRINKVHSCHSRIHGFHFPKKSELPHGLQFIFHTISFFLTLKYGSSFHSGLLVVFLFSNNFPFMFLLFYICKCFCMFLYILKKDHKFYHSKTYNLIVKTKIVIFRANRV